VIRRQGPLRHVGLAIALAVLLVGCSPTTVAPTPSLTAITPTPSPSTGPSSGPSASSSTPPVESPTPTPSPSPVLVPAPLDGELVTPAAAARHPIAVMIDDLSPARPQSGFSSASIVFQAPAEGGIPRYMAIFADGVPADVGPVRSARYYFIAWASEYKAMYVHAGGSPQALAALRASGAGQLVYNADEFRYGPYFRRISTRAPPHNLYTTGKQLRQLAGLVHATAAPKPIWTFNPPIPMDLRPVGGTISFAYPQNAIKYSYDRSTNTYLRTVSVEGAQHDASNKVRIAPTNVIVMWMKFAPLNDREPKKHRLEATLIGSGPAWISTNGKTIKGTWRKKTTSGPTLFYDSAGHQVGLTVGQTFVNVVTWGTAVTIRAGGPPPPRDGGP
jgi:hypothetical protein